MIKQLFLDFESKNPFIEKKLQKFIALIEFPEIENMHAFNQEENIDVTEKSSVSLSDEEVKKLFGEEKFKYINEYKEIYQSKNFNEDVAFVLNHFQKAIDNNINKLDQLRSIRWIHLFMKSSYLSRAVQNYRTKKGKTAEGGIYGQDEMLPFIIMFCYSMSKKDPKLFKNIYSFLENLNNQMKDKEKITYSYPLYNMLSGISFIEDSKIIDR